MSEKPFKQFELKGKPHLKVVNTRAVSQACASCGKAVGDGSLTSWIFTANRCQCQVKAQDVIPNIEEQVEVSALRPVVVSFDANSEKEQFLLESSAVENLSAKQCVDLGDRYEVLEEIGQGGSGQVYKVFDKILQLPLAIKLMRTEVAQDLVMKERFIQEAKLAITLTHENLVGMYGCNETIDGIPFIVMDYLEGRSLERILKEDGVLSEQRFISIFTQVLQGLSHAHMKGLIHRDIKPANIIITEKEPGVEVVKLIDFGIAKLCETSLRTTHNLTQTGEVFGTPAYMSPEQCLGFEVDLRSDIYSLGCVMYEAISGKPPFAGKNAVQIISKHLGAEPSQLDCDNEWLRELILECLAKEASERPQTVEKLLTKLQKIEFGHGRFVLELNLNKLKNLVASKQQDILPGLRFSYGISGLGIWWSFLLTGFAVLGASSLNLDSLERIFIFMAAYVLPFASFALLSLREQIRVSSKLVQTKEPIQEELMGITRVKSFFFGERDSVCTEVSLLFRGESKAKTYEGPANCCRLVGELCLPLVCNTWVDESGMRQAVQVKNATWVNTRHETYLKRLNWTGILITWLIVNICIAMQHPAAPEAKVMGVPGLAAFFLLAILIIRGLVCGFLRNERILAMASVLSLPMLVAVMIRIAYDLSFYCSGHTLEILLQKNAIKFVSTCLMPVEIRAIYIGCFVVMWLVYGIYKFVAKSGLIKLKKSVLSPKK